MFVQELIELFRRYGEVLHCRIFFDHSSDYGTSASVVRMHSVAAATEAIQALNGQVLDHHCTIANPMCLRLRFAETLQEKAVRILQQGHNRASRADREESSQLPRA